MARSVLILSWEYPPVVEGGLARHVRKLAEFLMADGVSVHVLTRGGEQRVPAVPCSAEHGTAGTLCSGVVVHRVSEPPYPCDDPAAFVEWVEAMNGDMTELGNVLCERYDFDIVHSHDWLVADAAEVLARGHDCPWITTVHATEYGRHQGWVGNYPQSHIHAAEQEMVHSADRVITCSEYMRTHVAEVLGREIDEITVIPNGIDPSDMELADIDLNVLRAQYARPGEHLVLLVGRLVYEKGFQIALEALPALVERLGNVRVVVAGSGTHELELRSQAEQLKLVDRVEFVGWKGDAMLHSLYRIADLCVVPSLYEPFGLVALEAMASGCPCIVADTGGLREVVPNDQVGLRFRARDAESLARKVERVLTDNSLRESLTRQASEHLRSFDWQDIARRTASVYAEAVAPALELSA